MRKKDFAMSVTVKTYFNFNGEPEIRRFSVDADASTNYDYLVGKIRTVYPQLKREDLQLFWKGSAILTRVFSMSLSLFWDLYKVDRIPVTVREYNRIVDCINIQIEVHTCSKKALRQR